MKAIGLIGYHNSGKTFTGTKIAAELKKRGYTVSAIKHIHNKINHADKDTTNLSAHCETVIGLSGDQVLTIEEKQKSLEQVMFTLHTDFVIIEGFKDAVTFPKIICQLPDKGDLKNDLAIAHIQKEEINDHKIAELCNLIEEKAFFLANTDCKKCGFPGCLAYAKEILAGKITEAECLSLPRDIHLSIDGEEFPMHPFVSTTLKGTILGFIQNLKGYKKGTITIKIP